MLFGSGLLLVTNGLGRAVCPKTVINYHPILHSVSEEQRPEPNIAVLRSVPKMESIDTSNTNKIYANVT